MKYLALACALTFAHATVALAREPADAAADLYDEGASAYEAGDYNRALPALLEADQLAPNDVTLALALRAALRASLPVLAMHAAHRAEHRGEEPRHLAREVRARFASEVAFLRVRCSVCEPRIDGQPIAPGGARAVAPGGHRIEATVRGAQKTYATYLAPGQSKDILVDDTVPRTSEASPVVADLDPRNEAANRRSRALFWVGVGVSAALGVGTGLSALDTRARHQTFQSAPSMETADAGERSRLRTNLLFGATAISSVVTALTGALFVKWRDGKKPETHSHAAR